jgi:RES domain-containing protein
MVHLQDHRVLRHYWMLQVELPTAEVLQFSLDQLPENWRDEPAAAETAVIGDDWLAAGEGLSLAVPSVVIPGELNYILNVDGSGFEQRVKAAQRIDFEPYTRL